MFSTHGKFTISIDGNIVIIEAEGPWNNEFFINMHRSLATQVSKIDASNFALLVILTGEGVATFDSLKIHSKYVKAGSAKAIAINVGRCDTPFITKVIFEKVYKKNNLPHQFFNDNADAKEWLLTFIDE
ncbi:MAG: hypothetical protein QF552_11335 [Litorilituus sp.]|nr:hypothetical protein [Litorilituus sp.]